MRTILILPLLLIAFQGKVFASDSVCDDAVNAYAGSDNGSAEDEIYFRDELDSCERALRGEVNDYTDVLEDL